MSNIRLREWTITFLYFPRIFIEYLGEVGNNKYKKHGPLNCKLSTIQGVFFNYFTIHLLKIPLFLKTLSFCWPVRVTTFSFICNKAQTDPK